MLTSKYIKTHNRIEVLLECTTIYHRFDTCIIAKMFILYIWVIPCELEMQMVSNDYQKLIAYIRRCSLILYISNNIIGMIGNINTTIHGLIVWPNMCDLVSPFMTSSGARDHSSIDKDVHNTNILTNKQN